MEGDAGASQLNPADQDDTETSADAPEAATFDTTAVVGDVPAVDTAPRAGDGAAAHGTSRLDDRGLTRVGAVLAVLAIAVAGGGYLALRANQHSRALARDDRAAIAAAEECVVATQAPDAASLRAAQQKIFECSTGDFGAQAQLYAAALTQAYQVANVHVQVSELRTALERNNPDGSVDLLLAMRVRIDNAAQKGQEFGYRLRVQMAQEDGRYKIAKLDQVAR
ncbi:MAG TPA: hypothetical protein VFR17_04405 [Mycobacterium sp.]|nr:hypothetical protein [Mycobacterium sp.]